MIRKQSITPLHAVFLLCAIAAVFFIVKSFGKEPEQRTIRLHVIDKNGTGGNPAFWLADSVRKGDMELSVTGGKIAEVIRVDGFAQQDNTYKTYVTVRVYGVTNKKTRKLLFKGRAIEVGAPIKLNLTRAAIDGQIIDINVPEKGYDSQWRSVTLRKRNAEPWVISNTKAGGVMNNALSGTPIAIVERVTVEPGRHNLVFTWTDVQLSSGDLILERNPTALDLVIHAKLLVEKHGEEWFFAGYQKIMPGNRIGLNIGDVTIQNLDIESVSYDAQPPQAAK